MHPLDAQYRAFPDFARWAECRVATDLWHEAVRRLENRKALAGDEAFGELIERTVRVASIDTGAVEGLYSVDRGFTMTVASMASSWEAEIHEEKGPGVAALVAAQHSGYDLALDAATSRTPISEAWIRRLHEVVCAPQDTYDVRTAAGPQKHEFPKGTYKDAPNHVEQADGSVHAYAPVETTPMEMHRLVLELRSAAFVAAHPVLQTSFSHYALVCVHPFADGNGRVARALASVFTFRAVSLPFVLFADQKDAYLGALAAADSSRFQSFVDFVLLRTVDLQELVAEQLAEAAVTPVEAAAGRLVDLVTYPEMKLIREYVGSAVEAELEKLKLPPSVVWEALITDEPDEYGKQKDLGVRVFIRMFSPRTISLEDFLFVVTRQHEFGQPPMFAVRRLRRPADALEIRRDQAHPLLTAVLEARLTAWVRRVIADLLTELAAEAEQT